MANPWLTYPIALVIAALVTVGALAVFRTDPADFQDPSISEVTSDGLSKMLEDKNASTNTLILMIGKLGEEPGDLAETVPALATAGLHKDELVRTAAKLAINRIGAPAVQHIDKLFNSKMKSDFHKACVVLQQMGPDGKEYVPKFKPVLQDSGDVRKVMSALFALQYVGPDAAPLMDELIALLDHEQFNIQCGACRIFENMGTAARPAQDRLVWLLENGNLSARGWAMIALGATGISEKHDIVGLLTEKLNAFTQPEKERAMIGLGHLGPEAAAAVSEVERLMRDPSKNSQPRAAYTFWKITGDSQEPLKILSKLVDNPSFMHDAVSRLGDMGTVAAPALSQMIKVLDWEEEPVVESAIMSIQKLGVKAEPALPALKKTTKHKDLLVAQAAREAIESINLAIKSQKK